MENNSYSLNLKEYTEHLKKMYGEYYLIKFTQEEKEKYITLYANCFRMNLKDARERVSIMIKTVKKGYAFATFNNFKSSLKEKYGEFYFVYMTFEEKNKLVHYYYKAMRETGDNITESDAFWILYEEEHKKYQEKIQEYEHNLERLEFMFSKKI